MGFSLFIQWTATDDFLRSGNHQLKCSWQRNISPFATSFWEPRKRLFWQTLYNQWLLYCVFGNIGWVTISMHCVALRIVRAAAAAAQLARSPSEAATIANPKVGRHWLKGLTSKMQMAMLFFKLVQVPQIHGFVTGAKKRQGSQVIGQRDYFATDI